MHNSVIFSIVVLWLTTILTESVYSVERNDRSIVKNLEKHVIKIKQPVIFLSTTTPMSTVSTTTSASTTTVTPTPTTTPTTAPRLTPNSTIETGIGCGTKLMRDFEVVRIESLAYGKSDYPNNEACTWKFIGKTCTVTTQCPCFNVPPSFDCLEDYLKFLDLPHYHQKFCGSTIPHGFYRASTDLFTIRFRSNRKETGRGFVCFVQCTPPGFADQITPNSTSICPS